MAHRPDGAHHLVRRTRKRGLFTEPEHETPWGAAGALLFGALSFALGIALPGAGFWACSQAANDSFKCIPIFAFAPLTAIGGTLIGASLGSLIGNRLAERFGWRNPEPDEEE